MLWDTFTILLSSLFLFSPHTQKHTCKPWSITTIIPLSQVVAQAAPVSFTPSPSQLPLLPPSNARHPLCCGHCPWCRRRLPSPSLLPSPLPFLLPVILVTIAIPLAAIALALFVAIAIHLAALALALALFVAVIIPLAAFVVACSSPSP
jgi:hypothetical protein